MPTIQGTAYPRLKSAVSAADLVAVYSFQRPVAGSGNLSPRWTGSEAGWGSGMFLRFRVCSCRLRWCWNLWSKVWSTAIPDSSVQILKNGYPKSYLMIWTHVAYIT